MILLCRKLEPSVAAEIMPLADSGKVPLTTVAYVARFPADQQRESFEVMRHLGARAAKRYVETINNPPSVGDIASRMLSWLQREFPATDTEQITQALRFAADALEQSH